MTKTYCYPVDIAAVPEEDQEGAAQTFHLIVEQLRIGYCTLNSENRLNFLSHVLRSTNSKLKCYPQTYYDERTTTYFLPTTTFGHSSNLPRRQRQSVQLPVNTGSNLYGFTSCVSKNKPTILYVHSDTKCSSPICDRPIQDF